MPKTVKIEMSMACVRFVYKCLTGRKVYSDYPEWEFLSVPLEKLVKEYGEEKVKHYASLFIPEIYIDTNAYDI